MLRKVLVSAAFVALFASSAMADEATKTVVFTDKYATLAAAFAISVAAFGGALSQAKTAAAALEGISRNPAAQGKIFVPMIISLALIESLVLYAFVIAFVKIKSVEVIQVAADAVNL
jgi:F-type H+-transporting ATPase subunit c